tara:strand:+ start:276 stop:419 length:144 start_codon:yes stop_codon:yes gene_type:complete
MIEDDKLEEASKTIARNTWENWIGELEEKDLPNCTIENTEDCENCGS